MRILIADSIGASRRALRSELEGWGYEVVEAEDGGEAIAALSVTHPPTLAILDQRTAVLDGVAVCREIRRRDRRPYVYVVLLAAGSDAGTRIEALEAGADDCLARPFDPFELELRLRGGRRIVELQEELLAAHEATRAQASRDPLTRLLTRGAILDALEREVARAWRLREPLAVVFVDLDHFKSVNDAHGHPAGDAVLCEAARRMAGAVRPYDPVGRYGGEEFLLTLPGCDGARARVVAERLRMAIERSPFSCAGAEVPLTASLGIAVFSGEKEASVDQLIGAADSALYRAKAEGRNRVAIADAPAEAAKTAPSAGERRRPQEIGAPVEVSRLREVSFEDDALLAELLDLFVVSTASRLPSLRSALEAGNAGLAEGEARAIKGESSHLGAARLGDLAFRLERACREGGVSASRGNLMREIEEEFHRVRAFVDRLARGADPRGEGR